jgi:hypothetical protein
MARPCAGQGQRRIAGVFFVGGKHTNQAMPGTDGAFACADLAGVAEEDLGSGEVDVLLMVVLNQSSGAAGSMTARGIGVSRVIGERSETERTAGRDARLYVASDVRPAGIHRQAALSAETSPHQCVRAGIPWWRRATAGL